MSTIVDPPWEGEQTLAMKSKKSNFLSRFTTPGTHGTPSASPETIQLPVDNAHRSNFAAKDEEHNTMPVATAFGATTALGSQHSFEEHGASKSQAGMNPTLGDRFNTVMPPQKRYWGLRRRMFLLVLLVAIVCLLALILGLAIGLSRKNSSSSQNLPLPSNHGIFTGDLTYYANELGLGACGTLSSKTDNICAVSHLLYDAASTSSNPNNNPLCGQMIRVTRLDAATGTNRSVDVKVIDRCVGCKAEDLDLSIGAFEQVADEAQGRVTGSWAWL